MQALIDHGYRLADEIFNHHDLRTLNPYFRDIAHGEPPATEAGKAVIAGAAARFAVLLGSAECAGVQITPKPPTPGELAYKAAADTAEFWQAVSGIFTTMRELFRVAPGIGLAAAAPAQAVKAEATAPTQIDILLKLPDAPLPVRIAAMPDRITTTEIERNAAGEIIASTQVERDRDAISKHA